MPTIGVNVFVLRQTAESRFSHYAGSSLVPLVEENFSQAKSGYRDGVLLVSVPPMDFYCGVVEVTPETTLQATFKARKEGEQPYIVVEAVDAKKLPAKVVEVVIYRRDTLLEEGPDAVSTEADWEIVSINARPTEEEEPLTPMAMARNFLELPGGTKAEYTAEEFARSIEYWSRRAMVGQG
jgi:hypothetical protein